MTLFILSEVKRVLQLKNKNKMETNGLVRLYIVLLFPHVFAGSLFGVILSDCLCLQLTIALVFALVLLYLCCLVFFSFCLVLLTFAFLYPSLVSFGSVFYSRFSI